jgi:3-hydroxybutyrate dehydrogenase
MIKMALDMFGSLDILVNNAGIQHVASLQESPVAKWDAIIAINLSSAFRTTRLALPAMIAKKWGRIVNIALAHGLVGSAFKFAYVAAKHGMLGLTKVTALETAELGITCNAICPGYVYTLLVEAQIDGQAKAHGIPREQVIRDVLLAQQPNKRFATSSAALPCSSPPTLSRRSPGPPSRSMAAGRRIERAQPPGRSSHEEQQKFDPPRSGQRNPQQR